jgi:hypothetical protein
MINLLTLIKKIIINGSNNETIADLTRASFEPISTDIEVKNTIIVTDAAAGRVDNIAKIYYNDASKLDFILKYNDISNPFSIDTGDILFIPEESQMLASVITVPKIYPGLDTTPSIPALFDPAKLSKKDKNRLQYIQKKSQQEEHPSATNLPPNFTTPDAKEVRIQDGKIVFGADNAKSKEDCKEPLNRAKIKAQLIVNKIFK